MSERKRSPNWQLSEKILLVDLVTNHFSILENKKTDGVTMKQKNAEWIKISNEFNAQTSLIHRTAENLKAQWETLKKTTKKEAAAARQSFIRTGGGPARPLNDNPLLDRIMGLISTAVIGLQNDFDGDTINIVNNDVAEELPGNGPVFVKIPDATVPSPKEDLQEDCNDWGDYTPRMLQSAKSAPLRCENTDVLELGRENKTPQQKQKSWSSKRRPAALPASSTALEDLHKMKMKAIEMQMNFAIEEREDAKHMYGIDMEIKKEVLKQEKIKTWLLLHQQRRQAKNTRSSTSQTRAPRAPYRQNMNN